MSRRTLKVMSLVLALVLVVPAGGFATTSAPTNGVWKADYLLEDPAAGLLSETSLRMFSLGWGAFNGLVQDEYTDLFLNPANITAIEGSRLYTNLANVQESNPLLTYDTTGSSNGLGFVTELAGNKVGVLFSQKMSSTDNSNSGSQVDKLSNPATIYNRTWDYNPTDKTTNLKGKVWFGRKLSDNLAIGANFSLANANVDKVTGNTYFVPGFGNVSFTHRVYTETRVSDSKVTRQDTSDYTVATKDKNQGIQAQVGAKMALGGMDLSVGGTFKPITIDYSETTTDTFVQELLNASTGQMDKTTTKNPVLLTGKGSGTGMGLDARLALPDNMIKFLDKVYLAANFDNASVPIAGEESSSFTTETAGSTTTSSDKAVYSGKLDRTGYGVGVGAEKEVGENARLLMGIKFAANNYNNENTFGELQGKDASGNPTNDYTTIKRNFKQNDMNISIPVGLEAKVMPKLTLRAGADAVVYSNGSSKVTTTTTETFTDGKVATEITDESQAQPGGKNSSTNSTYTVGVGYELNEKVQFDLVHYGKLFGFPHWAASATIKF